MSNSLINLSDEEFVIKQGRLLLNTDPTRAKALMLTAKTLFPNNFRIQFEAYLMEKDMKNVKESAKYFSELVTRFSQEIELWVEIDKVTVSLGMERDKADSEMFFLSEMFKNISSNIQQQLLIMTADHCEDTMEHCKLFLLLLRKFPESIPEHAPRLLDTMLSAEKHSNSQRVMCYRKLLVNEYLPIVINSKIDLNIKSLFRLLHKSIEFYINSLVLPSNSIYLPPESEVNEIWINLFQLIHFAGRHLGWDPYLTNLGEYWNREQYWQRILSFCQTNLKMSNMEEHTFTKQFLYCTTMLLLNYLYEYELSLNPNMSSSNKTKTKLIMLEAFTDLKLPSPYGETKSKRKKAELENTPHISVEKPGTSKIITNFKMACNCWDLLRSTENLQRELTKLFGYLKVEYRISQFLFDYSLYKSDYDEAFHCLNVSEVDPNLVLIRNLKLACLYYFKKNYSSCFEYILLVIQVLPTENMGEFCKYMAVGLPRLHFIYLPITQNAVLQYCTRMLVGIIRANLAKNHSIYDETSLGVLMILIQLDWPQQYDQFLFILSQIKARGVFSYPLFENYIVNVDILEEIMFLWNKRENPIIFNIFSSCFPINNPRRMGTRGADKNVKEDFKQAMKRQVSRSKEPINTLITKFITQERLHILQTIM